MLERIKGDEAARLFLGDLALGGGRKVNIDPGYMDFYKLVLASAKFQGQKIYLGKGVYADPTLYYDKMWKSYDWSFPDFKSGRYDEFLAGVRRSYKNKMRNMWRRDDKDEYRNQGGGGGARKNDPSPGDDGPGDS